jgi:hypothetical protein
MNYYDINIDSVVYGIVCYVVGISSEVSGMSYYVSDIVI